MLMSKEWCRRISRCILVVEVGRLLARGAWVPQQQCKPLKCSAVVAVVLQADKEAHKINLWAWPWARQPNYLINNLQVGTCKVELLNKVLSRVLRRWHCRCI